MFECANRAAICSGTCVDCPRRANRMADAIRERAQNLGVTIPFNLNHIVQELLKEEDYIRERFDSLIPASATRIVR